jgi:hypothetical protein
MKMRDLNKAKVKERALASRSAQAEVAALYVWPQRTLLEWDGDIASLDALETAKVAARVAWREASAAWEATVLAVQRQAQDVVRLAATTFRDQPLKAAQFDAITRRSYGRVGVYEFGVAVYEAWKKVDAAWQPLPGMASALFGSLLAVANAQQSVWVAQRAAWRDAAAALRAKLDTVHGNNVAWYSAVTTRFPSGTPEGDMIRELIPTDYTPREPAGQAVISNVMVSGSDAHLDAAAPRATRFTWLHQAPGSPVFAVVLADSPESHLTLHGQAPGLHRVKVCGSNSSGKGPESAVAEFTVTQQAVA